jgi:molecular chaperone GrpE
VSDKDYEIPVKVVDRRWWANQDQAAGDATRADTTSLKPTYVEELERQVAEKDRQLQELIAKHREAASEFESSRARLRREIARDSERGRREIIADLLEVLDNLDRALDATRSGASADALLQGVDLVRRQFLAKLEGMGVRRIEAEGQPFDPALHEAVTVVPAADPDQDGQIVGVVRQGYRIKDDVLRPAAVAVAKADDAVKAAK